MLRRDSKGEKEGLKHYFREDVLCTGSMEERSKMVVGEVGNQEIEVGIIAIVRIRRHDKEKRAEK